MLPCQVTVLPCMARLCSHPVTVSPGICDHEVQHNLLLTYPIIVEAVLQALRILEAALYELTIPDQFAWIPVSPVTGLPRRACVPKSSDQPSPWVIPVCMTKVQCSGTAVGTLHSYHLTAQPPIGRKTESGEW